jgi:hypothetical protein
MYPSGCERFVLLQPCAKLGGQRRPKGTLD